MRERKSGDESPKSVKDRRQGRKLRTKRGDNNKVKRKRKKQK